VVRSAYVLSAAIGGVVAAGVVALFDDAGPRVRTVIQQTPISASVASARAGLTAGDIYRRAAPGVVFVRARIVREVDSPFGSPVRQEGTATGSGFVIDRAGRIVTDYHVIAGAVTVNVQLADARVLPARIVGVDPSKDIALLRVDPARTALDPLRLGDSNTVKVGDPVLELGNPFGLERTLTAGIVSALQRHIRAPDGFMIENVIQTDAPVDPGNSGGPLLDSAGRVVGINSQIASDQNGGSASIAFAIPVDTVREDIPQLERTGRVDRGWLGVQSVTAEPALGVGVAQGAVIQRVLSGGPADRAGLRPGDVVVRIAGHRVRSADDLETFVASRRPGDRVPLGVVRGGRTRTTTVTLAPEPADGANLAG